MTYDLLADLQANDARVLADLLALLATESDSLDALLAEIQANARQYTSAQAGVKHK